MHVYTDHMYGMKMAANIKVFVGRAYILHVRII